MTPRSLPLLPTPSHHMVRGASMNFTTFTPHGRVLSELHYHSTGEGESAMNSATPTSLGRGDPMSPTASTSQGRWSPVTPPPPEHHSSEGRRNERHSLLTMGLGDNPMNLHISLSQEGRGGGGWGAERGENPMNPTTSSPCGEGGTRCGCNGAMIVTIVTIVTMPFPRGRPGVLVGG